MMFRETCQIDTALASLDKAIDTHYTWLVNIMVEIASAKTSAAEIIPASSHESCPVGRWLQSKPRAEHGEGVCIQAIYHAHSRLHESGHQLLLAVSEGRVSEHEFTDFKSCLQLFSSATNDYRKYLLNMRNGIDALTGLPGRRALDETFSQRLQAAQGRAVYMLMLDIDRFKNINDSWGHLVGDAVLRALARQLREWAQGCDTAYRYGGEEFILLLCAAGDEEACKIALRLCNAIADRTIYHDDLALRITATLGVTRVRTGETLTRAQERADAAMYRGKQTGRNRCMFMDAQGEIRHFVG